ncbi:hypothetical protein, partial [Acinetobacter calcoaceticus]|uniref:hypothetical protein n=1 Tax=Acinetobacter calcoaceticus TaxID=471 RepID=UPI0018DDAD44
PEIDPIKHLQLKEALRLEAMQALEEMVEAEKIGCIDERVQPLTQRPVLNPSSAKTIKNRQKRLRKLNKKK